MLKYLFMLLTLCLLLACQATDRKYSSTFTGDEAFVSNNIFPNAVHRVIESEKEIFALDDAMHDLVESKLKPIKDVKKRAYKLVEHLFNEENIGLAYFSNANHTASQTFHAKTANCMSLTILAYVLSKESGLIVNFQSVNVPEYWIRNGQYNMLTGHINLKVVKNNSLNSVYFWGSNILEIDFDPMIYKRKFNKKVITKDTVIAMFYNNKGAEAIADNDLELAFRYFSAAIEYDKEYSAVWGNLAILYRQLDEITLAEKSYKHAIELDENNLTALTNLSYLYRAQGKIKVASQIENRVHRKRIKNAYYHALLADESVRNGNNIIAIKHYKNAIKLNNKEHLFYFGLAKAYYFLQRFDESKKAMKKAASLAKAKDVNNNYLAKLSLIKKQANISH